jgi:hypothetical protein
MTLLKGGINNLDKADRTPFYLSNQLFSPIRGAIEFL